MSASPHIGTYAFLLRASPYVDLVSLPSWLREGPIRKMQILRMFYNQDRPRKFWGTPSRYGLAYGSVHSDVKSVEKGAILWYQKGEMA